jgi:hypothetical protein
MLVWEANAYQCYNNGLIHTVTESVKNETASGNGW